MNVIHKYKLLGIGEQDVTLPVGAKIIEVRPQDGTICLWAIIQTGNVAWEKRKIRIIATGKEFDSRFLKFINTVHIEPFVWHVFENMLIHDGTPKNV